MSNDILLNVVPIGRLTGDFRILYRPPLGFSGIVALGDRLVPIAAGGKGVVAGIFDLVFGRTQGRWVAALPVGSMPVPVTIRVNAQDGLADLTVNLNLEVTDPIKFAEWATQGRANAESGEPASFSIGDLRDAIADALDVPLQARTRRYLANSLESAPVRLGLWELVETELKARAPRWGLKFSAPPGRAIFVEPARAIVARLERAAEMQARVDALDQDTTIAKAARDAETADILRTIRDDYGAAAVAETNAVLMAAPAERAKGQLEALLGGFRSAFDARLSREVTRRATAIRSKLDADLAPKAPRVLVAPRPGVDPAQLVAFVRLVLTALSLGLTVYFGWAQWQAMRLDGPNQISYARELTGSLAAFVGGLSGLSWLYRVLRLRQAPPAPVVIAGSRGMPLRERQDYDVMVRGQVRRELDHVRRSVGDAIDALMGARQVEEAVALEGTADMAKTVANRIDFDGLGRPAYLQANSVSPELLNAMLDLDDKLLDDARAATQSAEDAHAAARAGQPLSSKRPALVAKVLGLEALLRERERVNEVLKARRP